MQLLLFGGWLLGTQTCVSTSCEFCLELFDASRSVDELQFAGVKRVANIANVYAKFFANAASLEGVTTPAGDFSFLIIGVDAVFHGVFGAFACVERQLV